jgi:TolB-like protein/tetratricopeptide (TPR) repeat protein
MAGIFLSYSREDRACAEPLAQTLKQAGHEVWWDRHIASGREFSAEIEAALEKVDLVLVAWSKRSAKSPWVRDEAAIGRDTGRLFPVLIDRSQPPIGFRQFQSFDLAGWKGRAGDPRTTELVDAVQARLSGKAAVARKRKRSLGALLDRRMWAVAAALALILAAGVLLFIVRPAGAEAEPASLAVLPFKNLSSDDPYFAEGVAEEILNQLAREPQFKVAGRTSSALFKDAADLRDVGRRLHVAYVLEGSVRSAGNQVRVDVSLVDARKGMRLWSQNFRGSLDDIFAIQESIGQQVAANLKRELVRTAVPPGSFRTRGDVYELYVTARSLIRTREPAKLTTAVELLQRAVKLDPNYAPAWARLAQATRMSVRYGQEDDPKSDWVRPAEIGYAERAIALAPNLAEGHAVLGFMLALSTNSTEAMKRRGRAEIERAVQLDPANAEAWYWLYMLREASLDFEGALAAVRRTAEIDPFFTFSNYYPSLAWDMGERDAALRFLNNRAQNHPDPYIRERTRGQILGLQNDWSAIYQNLKRARELARPDMRRYSEEGMGLMLLRVGLVDEARRHLPPEFLAMRLGQPPPASDLGKQEPMDFWLNSPAPLVARLLINSGRAAEIVSLYDRAFPSRNAMLQHMHKLQFVINAPIAAAALRDVGRNDEAMYLLATADRLCRDAIRRGRTPIMFPVDCSRSWAMLGRRDDAVRALEQGLRAGWRPEGGWSYQFVDEPVYRGMQDDPRLKKLGDFVRAENARERRELQSAGV